MKLEWLLEQLDQQARQAAWNDMMSIHVLEDRLDRDALRPSRNPAEFPCLLSGLDFEEIPVTIVIHISAADMTSGAFAHEFGTHDPGDDFSASYKVIDVTIEDDSRSHELEQIRNHFGKNFIAKVTEEISEYLDDAVYNQAMSDARRDYESRMEP